MKALDRIEVLSAPDSGYWMEKAYRIPTAPRASVAPGAKDFPTAPIGAMNPRAFVTNLADGATIAARSPFAVRGIAFGGATGVRSVEVSMNGGRSWHAARLEQDQGRYGFRRWDMTAGGVAPGTYRLAVRCTNSHGVVQTSAPIWNPSGYMDNRIETIGVRAA